MIDTTRRFREWNGGLAQRTLGGTVGSTESLVAALRIRNRTSVGKRANILLMLIVILPLVVMVWLGSRLARDERDALTQRLRQILNGQLEDVDQIIIHFFDDLKRDLRETAKLDSLTPDAIRSKLRKSPLANQILVLDSKGRVLHPSVAFPLNANEEKFLVEARQLISDRDLIRAADRALNKVSSKTKSRQPDGTDEDDDPAANGTQDSPTELEGWYVWYWGRGLNLIYWKRLTDGKIIAVAVERSRWLADLNAALPQTQPNEESAEVRSRVRLVDSVGRSIYQFGAYEPQTNAEPTTQIAVSEPLTAWRLQAYVPSDILSGADRSTYFNVVAGLIAAFITVTVLAVFFWREYARELREASQRVSFVNQVSHELKTPLTNIRMYADLLASDLNELSPEELTSQIGENDNAALLAATETSNLHTFETPRPQSRLKVIVSESQRLSRLIGNVLTFAKQQRNALRLKRVSGCVDDVVSDVLAQFEVALARNGIEVQFDPGASQPIEFDADALEQVLVNLIANVEKYAAAGKWLGVQTLHSAANAETGQPGSVVIRVSDRGPGIPLELQESVFQPFYRVSNNLEDVAGTGIGLAIARELSQLMSGTLKIVRSDVGCCFEVSLPTTEEA